MKEYLLAYKNSFSFKGRSRRKDFWLFTLVHIILVIGLANSGSILDLQPELAKNILMYYFWISLLPHLALTIRRLHDINKSGWWLLINVIPGGGLIILIFALQESDPQENTYGPSPIPAEDGSNNAMQTDHPADGR